MNVRAGTTADQIAAATLGRDTPLPSLELAVDSGDMVGNCDNGYDCAYLNTISWRTPTTPLPTERNPAVVFERLFGDGGTAAERRAQVRTDRSILDDVTADIAALQQAVGPGDRARVDEYLEAVREIERRLRTAGRAAARELPPFERPTGIPEDFGEHAALMFDLQWLAYQADVTRVTTFMLGRELGGRSYPELGIPMNHHGLSHHRDDPENLANLAKINTYHVELFTAFVEKLRVDAGRRRQPAGPRAGCSTAAASATRTSTSTSTSLSRSWEAAGGREGGTSRSRRRRWRTCCWRCWTGPPFPWTGSATARARLPLEPLSGI